MEKTLKNTVENWFKFNELFGFTLDVNNSYYFKSLAIHFKHKFYINGCEINIELNIHHQDHCVYLEYTRKNNRGITSKQVVFSYRIAPEKLDDLHTMEESVNFMLDNIKKQSSILNSNNIKQLFDIT